MNRSSTVVIREESWRFGNLHDNATTILNRLKHSGRIVVDCGRGLNRSSTLSGIELILSGTVGVFVGVRVNRGITDTPIHPDPSRFITNTVREGGRGAIGLNCTSTVSNRGRIEGIRSSTGVNRSAAVMGRSGTVDESCRHRRSILRHRIDAGFPFFYTDAPRFYRLAQIVVNRGQNRECVTAEAIKPSLVSCLHFLLYLFNRIFHIRFQGESC